MSMGKELKTVTTEGSETEDMDALRRLLEDLDVDGIITGAVWSDYQWERINGVCGDLGLAVISPLWRKEQDMLLDELIDSGISAMIIGTYADGLTEEWLGRMLDRGTADDLRKIRIKHDISVMGEGGEYESLTVDSPLQNVPLKIDSFEKEWKNMTGTMKITGAHL